MCGHETCMMRSRNHFQQVPPLGPCIHSPALESSLHEPHRLGGASGRSDGSAAERPGGSGGEKAGGERAGGGGRRGGFGGVAAMLRALG
jgi:hypothetical protein